MESFAPHKGKKGPCLFFFWCKKHDSTGGIIHIDYFYYFTGSWYGKFPFPTTTTNTPRTTTTTTTRTTTTKTTVSSITEYVNQDEIDLEDPNMPEYWNVLTITAVFLLAFILLSAIYVAYVWNLLVISNKMMKRQQP